MPRVTLRDVVLVAGGAAHTVSALLRKHHRRPVPGYRAVAYAVGLVATFAIKSIMGP